MTPAEFVELLKKANADELAQIRWLLGVSPPFSYPVPTLPPLEPTRVGPGVAPDPPYKVTWDNHTKPPTTCVPYTGEPCKW